MEKIETGKHTRLTTLLASLCMMSLLLILTGCGSSDAGADESAANADAMSAEEVNSLYAQEISKDLNHPNYYFEYAFNNGHVFTYDGNEDGIPEFVELGVGYNIPQCILVYRFTGSEVVRIPVDPEDVQSWTEPGACYTSVYFNEAADKFAFFSEDAHGDSRLYSEYQFDAAGDYTCRQEGTQHYGTGAEGTGSRSFSDDSAAEAAASDAANTMLTVAWNTGNSYPDNYHIHICSSIQEMREALRQEGIPVE